MHILGSFLRQLLITAKVPIPDQVIYNLQDIRGLGGKVGIEDILVLLKMQLQQLKCAFICIDAVDELEPNVRRQLLDTLKELATNNTRLFLTGRDHVENEIQNRLKTMQRYKATVSAHRQEIEAFVEQKITDDLNPDAMDEVLAKDIADAIIKKSRGM